MNKEVKLSVNNLKISFRTDAGKVQAVRDISFDLYKGETLAIVGESGSGKSVTSKAILGILAGNSIIEGGEVLYDGKDLLKIDEEEMHRIFDVNFFAMIEVSRLATRLMARNKQGAVVNIASIAGIDGDSRLDYSAAKAAVIAATKKMARELISVGIRVNALAPGFTDTDLVSGLSEKVVQEQTEKILMKRKAQPEEIANVAAFLASDMASYVTGQTWRADGGIL